MNATCKDITLQHIQINPTMKLVILLFTLIQVSTTTATAANRAHNKDYVYYDCNTWCTQALNQENGCGYYDEDISDQEYFGCLCTNSQYFSNLRSCDCYTKAVYYASRTICSLASDESYSGSWSDIDISATTNYSPSTEDSSSTGDSTSNEASSLIDIILSTKDSSSSKGITTTSTGSSTGDNTSTITSLSTQGGGGNNGNNGNGGNNGNNGNGGNSGSGGNGGAANHNEQTSVPPNSQSSTTNSQPTSSQTTSGAANYLSSISVGTFLILVLSLI